MIPLPILVSLFCALWLGLTAINHPETPCIIQALGDALVTSLFAALTIAILYYAIIIMHVISSHN